MQARTGFYSSLQNSAALQLEYSNRIKNEYIVVEIMMKFIRHKGSASTIQMDKWELPRSFKLKLNGEHPVREKNE